MRPSSEGSAYERCAALDDKLKDAQVRSQIRALLAAGSSATSVVDLLIKER